MCKVIEEMRKEEREEGFREGMKEGVKQASKESARAAALRMLAGGKLALEEIAEYASLPLDEVKKLQAGQTA